MTNRERNTLIRRALTAKYGPDYTNMVRQARGSTSNISIGNGAGGPVIVIRWFPLSDVPEIAEDDILSAVADAGIDLGDNRIQVVPSVFRCISVAPLWTEANEHD